ncbi:aminotransferase class V-fold PLP-dependent enzyme [Microbulbifer sp. SA54]|uniref:aminotransferase class V-fold PLP-dependent enzyme n=1 Tax=Microbulbifer sp. SA54 TaxID=3401577 RepID=UPI003AAB6937
MLHMACHSHHYWPDVTLDAIQQYWHEAAQLADAKWEIIFGEKIPAFQRAIADTLNLPAPEQIALAPNTHELVYRLLSAFDLNKPLRILTTDGEFYSFARQLLRLEEHTSVEVVRVPTQPFGTLPQRFEQELQTGDYQLAYASQVFFDSGVAFPQLLEIAARKPDATQMVIDGYHAFFARPTDLSAVADKVFYTAGSYKYLGAGEGMCFMSVPRGCQLRPLNTGWFAEMAELENRAEGVGYGDNWLRFAGATMDYSPLYKALAVLDMFKRDNISVETIHRYVQGNQQRFLAAMDAASHPLLNRGNLIHHDLENGHGHFFTFRCGSAQNAEELQAELRKKNVLCDRRQQLLRLGFAIYHPQEESFERLFT